MKPDTTRRWPELSRRGEKILIALLEHPTQEKAAAAAGISTVTLWRWLKKPEMKKAWVDARRDAFSQTIARLQQGSAAAAVMLLRVMADPVTPPASRIRAAQCILDHSARGIELQDFDVRLRELERSTHSKGSGKASKLTPVIQFPRQQENQDDETDLKAA